MQKKAIKITWTILAIFMIISLIAWTMLPLLG